MLEMSTSKKLVRSVQEKSTTAYWHLEPYLDPDAFSVKYSHRYDSPDSHLATAYWYRGGLEAGSVQAAHPASVSLSTLHGLSLL